MHARIRARGTAAACLALATGLAGAAQAQVGPTPAKKGPYERLTDACVEVTNFLPEPMSGLSFDGEGRVWAVNPFGSQVVVYSAVTSAPDLAFDTGMNPVSLAVWEPTLDPAERLVLVVCAGTHALFVHSAVDGRVLRVVQLDDEPSDLVVDDELAQAFVSCAGDDTVLQIDLATFDVVARYAIPVGERPGALALDQGDPEEQDDNRVYVAQTTTGNNSVSRGGGPGSSFGRIDDLDLDPDCDLPDEDVFRIDPRNGSVTPIVTGAGSLLFDVELNRETGALWILATDSVNKDPALDTEPLLNGRFAFNELRLVADVAAQAQAVPAGAKIDLDDVDLSPAGVSYDPARSVGQARALAIASPDSLTPGWALAASPTNDVILALDPDGRRAAEFQLPAGAQCYDLAIHPQNENVFGALCLGTRTIEFFTVVPFSAAPFASLPLGFDPTPPQIASGRAVFLDGSRSKDARFTCGSCHPGGRSDQLAWPLRGHPLDVKDVMVTQSLLSLPDTFPFHWRGERDLADFLKAFGGLLGADAAKVPAGAQAADFLAFLESLQAPANPIQNPRRILDDSRTPDPAPNGIVGSAVDGQGWFNTIPNFNGQTCGACHAQESGSDNNLFVEFGSAAPRAASVEAAHLRQLRHKGTETVTIDCGNGPQVFNQNGFGVTHNGTSDNTFEFIVNGAAFMALSEQQRTDVLRFVDQFDQGISPAAHWAARFDQNATPRLITDIEEILLDGAGEGWNDVVVFGEWDLGGGPQALRWWYDARAGLFRADDPAAPAVPWTRLRDDTLAGKATNVVMGLPPCNGRRFGIDQDNDGVINGQELLDGTDPFVPDFPSGDTTFPSLVSLELEFATARLAKYRIVADEDVRYRVDYGIQGGPQHVFERDYFSRQDTFVLTHAEPSTPTLTPVMHDLSLTLFDRAGNPTGPFSPNVPFTPTDVSLMFPAFGLFCHVAELEWTQEIRAGDTLDAKVRIEMDLNYGAPDFLPATDLMVFGIVAVEDPATGEFTQSTTFSSSLPSSFDLVDAAGLTSTYAGAPGEPWIVSDLTEASDPQTLGETEIDFFLSGLTAGQRVRFVVMGVGDLGEDPADPMHVVYEAASLFQFQQFTLEDETFLELVF